MSTYIPYVLPIESISQAQQAVVTFATAHPYTPGEIVSFRVPASNGMQELNNQYATVLLNDTYTITVNINSLNFNAFVLPPYQIAITGVGIDTPSAGFTQITFASNPFTNGQRIFFQDVTGTLGAAINRNVYSAQNVTGTTVNINLNSTSLVYGGGGLATVYPFSAFEELAVVVPAASGIIPGSYPATINLEDAFDNVPNT